MPYIIPNLSYMWPYFSTILGPYQEGKPEWDGCIRILSLKGLMSFQAALVPDPPPSRGVRSLPLGERVHAIGGGPRRLEVVGEGGASRPRLF